MNVRMLQSGCAILLRILSLWLVAFDLRADSNTWQAVPGKLPTRFTREVSPTNAHLEYPRPQLVRPVWQNLNGLWDYAITGFGAAKPTNYAGKILVPFPIESALSGVGVRLGEKETLWYRRTVRIPGDWAGKKVCLHFGAVDWHSRVFVNGNLAGEHRGGFDSFSLEITRHLGWNGEEELVIAVQDPTEGEQPRGKQSRNPEGIFYTPSSGIWQTVWLEPVPAARIDALEIIPEPGQKSMHLKVVANRLAEVYRVEAIAYEQGKEVARGIGPANGELELAIEKPRWWSPADPFLYDLKVTLLRDETPEDEVTSYFALRTLAIRKDTDGVPRLTLNGEPLFQVGVLDQGFWPDGLYTAPCDAAVEEELKRVKQLGFNTVRKHVKVEPQRWYAWCDRLGLMVWQDMPSGNNLTPPARRQFEVELQRMITSLRNHPCIVMWVLFNEGWGQYDTARLTQLVRDLDASRLVNSASGWVDKQAGDILDLHTYPGPEAPAVESSRAAVLGEFGGVGLTISNHVWSVKTWGYERVQSSALFNTRYTDLLNRAWSLYDSSGLSAAIYTQLTDVETECNGLITYDREIIKMDPQRARAANLGELRETAARAVLATGGMSQASWRYTFEAPPIRWTQRVFDVSKWSRGRTPFGLVPTPAGQDVAQTAWNGEQIWMRRFFMLPPEVGGTPRLKVSYSGDAEIYLNGLLAASLSGRSESYVEVPIHPVAAGNLREGLNVIAVHARKAGSSQFIDVGIDMPAPAAKTP